VGAEILELPDDPEAARRCLDAAGGLVARLLVVAPGPGLPADGQGFDALNDRVIRIDVAVEATDFAVGDDVDARRLHVVDRRVGRVVEHLFEIGGAEVAGLVGFHRHEPPPRFSVGADDGGGNERQGIHDAVPPIMR